MSSQKLGCSCVCVAVPGNAGDRWAWPRSQVWRTAKPDSNPAISSSEVGLSDVLGKMGGGWRRRADSPVRAQRGPRWAPPECFALLGASVDPPSLCPSSMPASSPPVPSWEVQSHRVENQMVPSQACGTEDSRTPDPALVPGHTNSHLEKGGQTESSCYSLCDQI